MDEGLNLQLNKKQEMSISSNRQEIIDTSSLNAFKNDQFVENDNDFFFDEIIDENVTKYNDLVKNVDSSKVLEEDELNDTVFHELNDARIYSKSASKKLNNLKKGKNKDELKKSKKEAEKELSKKERKELEKKLREEYYERTLYVANEANLAETLRTKTLYKHQVRDKKELTTSKGKILNVRAALTTANLGDLYKTVDQARMSGATKELHHSYGTKLLNEGHNVLEFNCGGSTFNKGFRREASGVKGRKDEGLFNEKGAKKKRKRTHEEVRDMYKHVYGDEYPLYKGTAEEFNGLSAEELQQPKFQKKLVKGIRYKDRINENNGCVKRKITIPGVDGNFNSGDFAIDKVRVYIKDMGANYLSQIFNNWIESGRPIEDMKDVHINLEGHSRGAVSSTLGAMTLRAWIRDNYPQFLNKVKFNLIAHEPVPGVDADSLYRHEVDIKRRIGGESTDVVKEIQKGDSKMMPLEDCANTTVFYSLNSKEGVLSQFFDPMKIKGSDRIIITTTGHASVLKDVDTSQYKDKKGNIIDKNEKAHNAALTDAQTGNVYRGTGISELPRGVYFMDELGTLVKVESMEEFNKVVAAISDISGEKERKHRISEVADEFFREKRSQTNQNDSDFNDNMIKFYQESKEDKGRKSTSYKNMENAILNIQTEGTVDSIAMALLHTRAYLIGHDGYRFTSSGDRRVAYAKKVEEQLFAKLASYFAAQDYKSQLSIIAAIKSFKLPNGKPDTKVIDYCSKQLLKMVTKDDSVELESLNIIAADKYCVDESKLKIDNKDEITDNQQVTSKFSYDRSNELYKFIFEETCNVDNLNKLLINIRSMVTFDNKRGILNYPEFVKFVTSYTEVHNLYNNNKNLLNQEQKTRIKLLRFHFFKALWDNDSYPHEKLVDLNVDNYYEYIKLLNGMKASYHRLYNISKGKIVKDDDKKKKAVASFDLRANIFFETTYPLQEKEYDKYLGK